MIATNQYHLAANASPASRRLMEAVSYHASELISHNLEDTVDCSKSLGLVVLNPTTTGRCGTMAYDPSVARAEHRFGWVGKQLGLDIRGYRAPENFLPTRLDLKNWSEERYLVSPRTNSEVVDIARRRWGQVESMEYNLATGECTEPKTSHHAFDW